MSYISLAGICFLCTGFAVLPSKYSFSDLWLGSRRRKRKWKLSMTTWWLLPSITTVKGTNISVGKVCIRCSLCFFITMCLPFYNPTLGFLCLFWTCSYIYSTPGEFLCIVLLTYIVVNHCNVSDRYHYCRYPYWNSLTL